MHINPERLAHVTGERSRVGILVVQELKNEYVLTYHGRLQLKVTGDLKWDGKQGQGQLETQYDGIDDMFRAP